MAALKTAPLLLTAFMALTACQTTVEANANRPGNENISLNQVILLADSICGTTRPNFAGAKDRMRLDGLTVEKDGRNFSPTQAVSAALTTTPEGRTLCAVRASFAGNEFTLDKAMADQFGPPRMTGQITPPARLYNLGAKGNLLLIIRAKPGRTVTTYEIGYATGI